MGETGKWDLILRFIYQVPYGQSDPLFGKDIGFYLFSLPVYVALKNWLLLDPAAGQPHGRRDLLRARRHQSGPSALARFVRRHRAWLRPARSLFRGEGLVLCAWTATCCSTTTTASWSAPATPMSMSSCRCSGC